MKKIRTIKCIEFSSRTLALLLTVVLVMAVSNASAKGHKPRETLIKSSLSTASIDKVEPV